MTRAYHPYHPARRPGGKPPEAPVYRVLVHRQFKKEWNQLPDRVGMESAQQLWDHLAREPGVPSPINQTTILKGKYAQPKEEGFSRTVHQEISGAARVDYQWSNDYKGGAKGDPHAVVRVLTITFTSH